ncbi:hypothetical protein EXIGLDRAFT_610771 [Exidia glandulosa HHB12029]|uniref:Uncharacterized protein n=1 Tax=Exidia glandulosa HHB12029 TaxID=1314781 RepID=A0A165JT33_EXIGL|nr:hypothetical protein EXIGLDRAFT_610771 [Exidia glandulosa HHB12029]
MLRQICRRGRLEALIKDAAARSKHATLQKLCAILFPASNTIPSQPLTSSEVAAYTAKSKPLSDAHYDLLLNHLNQPIPLWRHRDAIPHPPLPKILPSSAKSHTSIVIEGYTYSTSDSHLGNSSVLFSGPHVPYRRSGFIQHIWTIPLDSIVRIFMLVRLHWSLTGPDEAKSPYPNLPPMATRVILAQPTDHYVVVEPLHIVCHLVLYRRPRGTFEIDSEVYAACTALERGRK